jgi:NADH:ubiquinone oxidoreductase subunit D
MKKYSVMGNVSFDVQLEVNSDTYEEAMAKAESLINSYNVIMRELQLLTLSSDYIKVKLNDVEVDWQTAFDDEEE